MSARDSHHPSSRPRHAASQRGRVGESSRPVDEVTQELSTPLSALLANLEFLKQVDRSSEEAAEALRDLELSALAMVTILDGTRPDPAVHDAGADNDVNPAIEARVLIIDDDETYLRAQRRQLRDYDVTTCSDPAAALSLLASGADFDLILCDLMMPKMNGKRLFEQAVALRPELARRFAFATGGSLDPELRRWLREEATRCLLKPVRLAVLRELIDHHE